MSTWTNKDGLKVNFNLTAAQQVDGGVVSTRGNAREMVINYNSQDVGGLETAGDTDGREPFLPANAVIKDARFVVETAFTSAGATTLTIGLAEADGTVIDADGIDATIVKTAIDAVGDVVVNDGALVNASVGTADAFVYFTVGSGPWTAGAGKLIIEYTV